MSHLWPACACSFSLAALLARDARQGLSVDIERHRVIHLVATTQRRRTQRDYKAIAVGGTVTLKGGVASGSERAIVAAKAASVAGQGNVVNQLVVAAK